MNEWKTISGFDRYEVSNGGQVRNRHTGRLLGLAASKTNPYCRVILCKAGKRKQTFVHALVAQAFVGPRPEGYQINHRDGNKLNNRADNLEYVSHADNLRHARELGLIVPPPATPGERHPQAKLTEADVREIRQLRGIVGQRELSKRFGVSQAVISRIQRYEKWQHVA